MGTQPVKIDNEGMDVAPRPLPDIKSVCESVLLVEDETFVREVTREVLVAAGYLVLTAINAADALKIYDSHAGEIDLLLTDVVLPGEDGRALARQLRQRDSSLSVLLVTGYGEQMAVGQTSSNEANQTECLPKPFSGSALLRRIRNILERK